MIPFANVEYTSESANKLLILDNVGDDMIAEMIRLQLEKPMSHLVLENYLQILDDKKDKLIDEYGEGTELLTAFYSYENEIYEMIAQAANVRYGISIETNGDEIAYKLAIKNIYDVLYLNYKDTIITLFASYIYKNRKGEIQEWIESKKDISSSSAKKTYKDIREALIMSNLPIIVEMLENIYLEDSQVIEYLNWEDHSAMNVSSFIDNYNENIIIIENFYTSLLTPYLEYKEESDGLVDSEVKSELSMILYSNFQTEDVIIVGSSYDPSLIDGEEEVDEIDEINKAVSDIQSEESEGDE